MKIKDLLNELTTYNLEAEFEIYVNDKPAEFEICCGGAEGVTPSNCDHVTIFVDSTVDNDSYASVEEVRHGYWSHIRSVVLDKSRQLFLKLRCKNRQKGGKKNEH